MSQPWPEPQPGTRILGARREALAEVIVHRYDTGESIRAIASDIRRSYGFVHRVLTESEVCFRARGGNTRPPGTPDGRKKSELARLRTRIAELQAQLGSG